MCIRDRINDILDMSRMEQGMVTLNNTPIDLKACVEECLETFRYQAEQQGKQLTWGFSLENNRLLADPFRLQQILNNLLSDAVVGDHEFILGILSAVQLGDLQGDPAVLVGEFEGIGEQVVEDLLSLIHILPRQTPPILYG